MSSYIYINRLANAISQEPICFPEKGFQQDKQNRVVPHTAQCNGPNLDHNGSHELECKYCEHCHYNCDANAIICKTWRMLRFDRDQEESDVNS